MEALTEVSNKGVAVAAGDAGRSNDLSGTLMQMNGLKYVFPSNLSVVQRRRLVKHASNKATYGPNETILVRLNTGADYVMGRSSFLEMDVTLTDSNAVGAGTFCYRDTAEGFLSGSAINLIQEIALISHSGTELERITNVGLIHNVLSSYTQDNQYNTTINQMAGGEAVWHTTPGSSTQHRVLIPMSAICGLFASNKLIPSMLASGMQINITLQNPTIALKHGGTADAAVTYTLSNVSVVTDSYSLADAISRKLIQEASKNSLEFFWESIHESVANAALSGSVSIQSTKTVSRALRAWAVNRVSGEIADVVKNSLNPAPYNVTSYRYRLGSQFFPEFTVSDGPSLQDTYKKSEHYMNALYSFDGASDGFRYPNVSHKRFTANMGISSTTLERSSVLNLSGIPISNGRILELSQTYSAYAGAITVNMFTHYVKLARVFLRNVVVKE